MLRRLIFALCLLTMAMCVFVACEPGVPGPCNPNPCLNGSTCADVDGLAECTCAGGYSGDICDIPPAAMGYNSLFMGHSFFLPIAAGMAEHAHGAGFVDHTQQTFFAGGASGAPQALWDNSDTRNAIQAVLNSGEIELFGMTYHPDFPGIEGYKNWVEYALLQNPDTRFFIALPWATNPADEDVTEYEASWETGHPLVIHDGHIDTLRADYTDSDFYCIPYGQGAVELYKLFDSGKLFDVQTLVSENGSDAIFRDSFGHPDDILITLGQLIWLNAIYGVDLNSYDYDTGYSCDLKAIAQDIMDNHDSDY